MTRTDLHVAQSALRCPYCHADVDGTSHDWVACRGCMARHHAACWGERGACASCGARVQLVEAPTTATASNADAVRRLEIELAVARLDLAWSEERVPFCRKEREKLVEPGVPETIPFLFLVIGGILILVASIAGSGGPPFPMGFAMAVAGVAGAIYAKHRRASFVAARERYAARRSELLGELGR